MVQHVQPAALIHSQLLGRLVSLRQQTARSVPRASQQGEPPDRPHVLVGHFFILSIPAWQPSP